MPRKTRSRASTSAAAPARALILIVEDNDDLRNLYASYFLSRGFRVATASDGALGFAEALRTQPAAIVTDLLMPHVDGWEMTRRVKNDARTAHILVIACTGRAYGGAAERALDAGCDAYVLKPCLPEDLVWETERALARRAAHRRSA